jgi:anti-sigma B factor antagonist
MLDTHPRDPAHRGTEFWLQEERPHPGLVVITAHGDTDLRVASELEERLAAAIDDGTVDLVLDLSYATFVDSMALGVIVGARKRLRASGGRLRLVIASEHLRRVLEVTLLDRVFPVHGDRGEALAAVGNRLPAGG